MKIISIMIVAILFMFGFAISWAWCVGVIYQFIDKNRYKNNNTEQKLCCLGCKHFFYWNDGSAGCDLDKQYICTRNNFILREEEDDLSKL